jgi:hypothetical protein
MFNVGLATLCVFVALDFVIRLRMKRIGKKWAFLLGALFDYGDYLKVRAQYGWAAWPVYLLWSCFIIGVILVVIGTFR